MNSLNVGRIAVLAQEIQNLRIDLSRKEAELKSEIEGKKNAYQVLTIRGKSFRSDGKHIAPSQTPEYKSKYYLRRKAMLKKAQVENARSNISKGKLGKSPRNREVQEIKKTCTSPSASFKQLTSERLTCSTAY